MNIILEFNDLCTEHMGILTVVYITKINICIYFFFLACEQAEFSKSCDLIGSGSRRKFSILPAHARSDSARLARCVFISRRDERTQESFALQN